MTQIGGSLAGLLCGVALKHAGHTVQIVEQHGNERESQGAGLGLGQSAQEFLQHHDRIRSPFSHIVTALTFLRHDGTFRQFDTGARDITSWNSLFHRLRSLFDGVTTHYRVAEPERIGTDGPVTYDTHRRVLNISRFDGVDRPIDLTVEDCRSGEVQHVRADVVVGADGPSSCVRAKYMPNVQRRYVGYIMWRGLVPEDEVSLETRAMSERSVIAHRSGQQHCISKSPPYSRHLPFKYVLRRATCLVWIKGARQL